MILKIECISGPNLENECYKIFEISERDSLFDLHLAIINSFEFSYEHAYVFYSSRNPRSISSPLSSSDSMKNVERDYESIKLKSLWPLKKQQQLYYLYDFGDKWIFKINRITRKDDEKEIKELKVLEAHGENPKQYN